MRIDAIGNLPESNNLASAGMPRFRAQHIRRLAGVCLDATYVFGWIGHTESAGIGSLAVAPCDFVGSARKEAPIAMVESMEDLPRNNTRPRLAPPQCPADGPQTTAPLRADSQAARLAPSSKVIDLFAAFAEDGGVCIEPVAKGNFGERT